MHKGFEPVYNEESQILILGSFPSVKSRLNGFYYGNKQNRFWRMLETIFNEKIGDDITNKKNFLLKHKIALFDVVMESNLAGSADASLEKSSKKIANLNFLFPPNTNIKKVLCNGKTSYNLFLKNFLSPIPVFCLPSTSSANPYFNLDDWKIHLNILLTNN